MRQRGPTFGRSGAGRDLNARAFACTLKCTARTAGRDDGGGEGGGGRRRRSMISIAGKSWIAEAAVTSRA